jgi:AcrR family transcriptional regulator
MTTEASTAGLRERKKQRTRTAIIEAAMGLFVERGFDQTTVADIAAAADIAPRTFFGYFPSKEDVVFHDFDEFAAQMRRRIVDERLEDETAIDAVRSWFADFLASKPFDDEAARCRRAVIDSSAALRDHDDRLLNRLEEVLAEAVAMDLGESADALRPRMVAGATIAAFHAIRAWGAEQGRPKPVSDVDEAMHVIDDALTFARGGIAALQERASS